MKISVKSIQQIICANNNMVIVKKLCTVQKKKFSFQEKHKLND